MKTLKILSFSFLAFSVFACGGKEESQQSTGEGEVQNEETSINSLDDKVFSDTVTIGGKLYKYTCTLEHIDSLIVINPQGEEYVENRVKINVQQGETTIFDKVIDKSFYKDIVPSNLLRAYTMVGVSFNFTKLEEDRSALYFIVTAGDPDETANMDYPLELKVATDGTYSLKEAENLETMSLNPGLNIDPSADATI